MDVCGSGGWEEASPASPWGLPRGQTGLDTLQAHPYPRVHCPESYIAPVCGTPGLSRLTIIALIGCIHTSLSSKGTPACLHRP